MTADPVDPVDPVDQARRLAHARFPDALAAILTGSTAADRARALAEADLAKGRRRSPRRPSRPSATT
ncbi:MULTISPECIES: hypothetical protein [Streptomyces]|uniref:Uncharacterized protein n=1 Tax=Streptomyces viridochromogenes TaxID=1938 RepID=A0A0L8LFB3_STRVR|nr:MULTISPECIES: hypothetical protein [Streptomyces]KOG36817.1 hypothetical protein ADK34_00925 [Streptomyces viridochromogenes]